MDINERSKKAQEIAATPELYMICEGCDSIVVRGTPMCPNCHAYRFDSKEDRVVEQAIILGSREQRSVSYDDLI